MNLIRVQEHLKNVIHSNCHADVGKITPILVKDAINHLKNNRTDPVNDFTSDFLKHAPFALCEKVSMLFKQYLIHVHVSSNDLGLDTDTTYKG